MTTTLEILNRATERVLASKEPYLWDGIIILEAIKYRLLLGVKDGASVVELWWDFKY